MKKFLLISAVLISAFCYKAESQVSVNINIGRQPIWGPVGYNYVDYYYLPDLDVYYDVPRGMFVYFDFGRWNFAGSLPARFGHYDLYHSYKVVVNTRNPWLRNSYYRSHYARYRGHYQPVIRDSHDRRYYAAGEHYNNGRGNERREYSHDVRRDYDHNDRRNSGRDNGRVNGGRNNGHDYDHGRGNHENHDRH